MENTPLQKISFLVMRGMASLIFVTAGLNHLFNTAGVTARLQKVPFAHMASRIAPPETLIILSGIGLLLGGFMLLAGFRTRVAAAVLLAILIPITLTVQVANLTGAGPLFKNIALMGVLLFFMANGAVYYSLDQLPALKKKAQDSMRSPRTGRYVAVLATVFVMLLGAHTTAVQAQQATTTAVAKKKYAVLISLPNHLRAAVNTAETVTPNSAYNRGSFVVMACGKSVEAFVKGSNMAQELEQGSAAGVTYKVCGLSLKQFSIDPKTLVDGVEVVPNGLTYMFDLQQQGYITVEL